MIKKCKPVLSFLPINCFTYKISAVYLLNESQEGWIVSSQNLFHKQHLANGLILTVYDQTEVYFGDYHHVRLNIVCSLEADSDAINHPSPDEVAAQSISYSRTLGKMGVASEDIESVKASLFRDFQRNALPYLSSPGFPQKMMARELAGKKLSARRYAGAGF